MNEYVKTLLLVFISSSIFAFIISFGVYRAKHKCFLDQRRLIINCLADEKDINACESYYARYCQ